MPLEIGVWRIDSGCHRVEVGAIGDESRLEDLLDADISIASPNWMVIGRQVRTDYGSFIDLLAIDRDGNIVVIELKRNKTPREVIAQVLDYASWVKNLDDDDIGRIFGEYLKKYQPKRADESIDQAFCSRFKTSAMPENLNEQHELVVVAATLDESTERIVRYLSEDRSVAVNVIFFRVFRDGDREYLTRAWLIDPTEVATVAPARVGAGEWNGEYYVSFGQDDRRNWEDARKYGFISGGGGSWYSKTLQMLEPGHRVWVNIPGEGYVGVGTVTQAVVKFDQFKAKDTGGKLVPLPQLKLLAKDMLTDANDESAEYVVGIDWIQTRTLNQAVHEKGFFGNQNTVCQPTAKKWGYTVERLSQIFGVEVRTSQNA